MHNANNGWDMAGHLLQTENPAAAAEANSGALPEQAPQPAPPPAPPEPPLRETGVCPVPDIGDIVIFHPRRGEMLRGRTRLAAIVTHRDIDTRLLELLVIRDPLDHLGQERVPEWNGRDRGWEPKYRDPIDQAFVETDDVATLRDIVLGDFVDPKASVMQMLADLDDSVEALTKRLRAVEAATPTLKAPKAPAKKAAKAAKKRK
jgi:hypothetical protein